MTSNPPVMLDRRRDALLRQLNLINGGVFYVYEIANPETLDQSKLSTYLTELLGYPPGHLEATRRDLLRNLSHPRDRRQIAGHYRALAKLPDGEFTVFICRMKHFDASWRWIEARERVFSRSRAGDVRRVLGFANDITERRRLLDSLAGATEALLLAEENERRRIGRELHDSTTQHLVAIDLTLSRLELRMGSDPLDRAIIQDIRVALTAAHREIRTFSYLLHPPQLERVGLEAALSQFLEGFQRRTGLRVRFQVLGRERVLGQHSELGLFRVAQEALMNIHRHAQAREAEVRLSHLATETVLEISDDGIGLSPAQILPLLAGNAAGVGIASMRARIEDLGGLLDILAQPKGLLIRATMPRRRASDAPPIPTDILP
jgi:signal transduction histidine kinase